MAMPRSVAIVALQSGLCCLIPALVGCSPVTSSAPVAASPAVQGGNSAAQVHATPLGRPPGSGCSKMEGSVGVSDKWGSGWIDLNALIDFSSGTRIRVGIGGSAQKVVVRLLKEGESPDEPVGVLGVYDVPGDRVVEVTVSSAVTRVRQISVHGGPQAWRWFLGTGNGSATLLFVERCE